jgi:hypothetical protein
MLTKVRYLRYAMFAAPHWVVGFGRSFRKGAEALCHKVHSFFYALHFSMVGGVMGSREACRFLFPVDQPVTSSAAQSLVASVGGLTLPKRSNP